MTMFLRFRSTPPLAGPHLVMPAVAFFGLLGVISAVSSPVGGFAAVEPAGEAVFFSLPAPAPETPVAVPEEAIQEITTTTVVPVGTSEDVPVGTSEDVPVGTSEDIPVDPMSQEQQGEPVPEGDVTVPPPPDDGTENLRKPPEILWSNVRQAERKLEELEQTRLDALTSARTLRKRRKELTVKSQQLDAESAATVAELAAALDRLQARAVLGFQQFGSGSESEKSVDFSDYKEVVDDQRRSRMVDSALKFDAGDIGRLDELRGRLSSDGRAALDRIRVVSQHLNETELEVAEVDRSIADATVEAEAFRAGSQIFIHGVVFPIAPGYSTPLIDSWGFPRMVGTEDEHGHEGIDIFAPRGTPLVAAERGVIARVGSGRLGGLKFWLHGESGTKWYYAHLDSFAPDLVNGAVVDAGTLLGYVGDTGNAVGTPPHLHLQMHPGGGDPINPYPLLKVVSDLDQAAVAAGTFQGYAYQAIVADRPEPEVEPAPAAEIEPAEVEPAPQPLEEEEVETPVVAAEEPEGPPASDIPPPEVSVPEPEPEVADGEPPDPTESQTPEPAPRESETP